MDKKRTINDWKVEVSPRLIEHFRNRSNSNLCRDLKPLIEQTIGQKIRKVVCYNAREENGGFCDTCSFFYSVVDIFFKSSEGDMCKLTVEQELGELIRNVEKFVE